jgi:hypothetical protein
MKVFIKKIIQNEYIGFLLFIKDLSEIIIQISNGANLKTIIMDANIYINIIINLFIGIVIYNLLIQYKSKIDKKVFDTSMNEIIETNETLKNKIAVLKAELCLKERNIHLRIKGVAGDNLYYTNEDYAKKLEDILQDKFPQKSPIEIKQIILEYLTK